MAAYFVAGTDTEVGKTYTSCRLLEAASDQGLTTLGLKPIAAGCELVDGQYQNEDAQALMASSSIVLPYDQVNPVALPDACSPHIAAAKAERNITAARLAGFCRGALMRKVDFALVEGAGGWRVPISNRETMASLAMQLRLPVILVVGMRLGCINHALLTAEAIQRDGLKLAGWVANQLTPEPMPFFSENLSTLQSSINAPLMGVLKYANTEKTMDLRNQLDINCLAV